MLTLSLSVCVSHRSRGGKASRLDPASVVSGDGLQARGQDQQEVCLQGRARQHEDVPLCSRHQGEHEPMGQRLDSRLAIAGSQSVSFNYIGASCA